MELYDLVDPVEQILAKRAEQRFMPLGGTMELTPLCNMDCKMCYVRLSKEQMDKQGAMLTCNQWLSIANEAKRYGVLYLLITGGEPLIYPEFEQLYTQLVQMGFVISINTNGTLIDQKWADLFGKYPCRRLSITLYGKDDATYARLCNNPTGFTQVMRAAEMLKERRVPFRFTCSVTTENKNDLPELHRIACKLGVELEACSYMFPPIRKGFVPQTYCRMTPQEAAASVVENHMLANPESDIIQVAQNTISKTQNTVDLRWLKGLNCRAGRSGFWMNWKGEMLPCGMFSHPKISLLENPFLDCWKYVVLETQKIKRCRECDTCSKATICKMCAAACLAETGSFEGKPEYLCRMTDEELKLCEEIVSKG